MPRGWAGEIVPAIDPARVGYCHPAQAKRTKCACGAVIELGRHGDGVYAVRCECGRLHRKDPNRSAFADTGRQPVRPGGAKGCPGCQE